MVARVMFGTVDRMNGRIWMIAGAWLFALTVGAQEGALIKAQPQPIGKPKRPVRVPGMYAATRVGVHPVTAAEARPWLFTEQYLAFDGDRAKLGEADALTQAREVARQLEAGLQGFGSSLDHCMRLHVCLKRGADRLVVEQALTENLKGNQPAVTYVVSDLQVPEALVGMDAVGYTGRSRSSRWNYEKPIVMPQQGVHGARHALLPPGRPTFISGQAVKGDDMAASARKTMEQLATTLKFLDRDWTNVVQVKAFLRAPTENVPAVREVVGSSFQDTKQIPPQVYVEWISNQDLEIELVVDGGPPSIDAPLVEYLTPPGMKSSPVFCRVVRGNNGKLVYSSGVTGPAGADAETQVKAIFGDLSTAMAVFRVDMRHLVKATYYVSDGAASKALNALRPRIYDPERPPAASKAMVRGTALPGATAVVDIIGIAPR